MVIKKHSNPISDDHIDPKRGALVCGLDTKSNLAPISHSANSAKTNRFVPYRVHTLEAPRVYGDLCEFLIKGEWTACVFGEKEWWDESNLIGNGDVTGGKTQGDVNRDNGHWDDLKKVAHLAICKGVLLTRLDDGHVFYFPTRAAACQKFKLHATLLRDTLNGKRHSYNGFTAIPFID